VLGPLTDILKPRQKLVMSVEGEQAFNILKDFSKPFYIDCDASNTGVGVF